MIKIPSSLLSEFISAVDDEGFVPLKVFSQKMLKRSVNEASTFFDPKGRFYDRYQKTVTHNIRHNVTFTNHFKKNGSLRNRSCEGGVHKDDLVTFIKQAQEAIEENTRNFDAAYKKYYEIK